MQQLFCADENFDLRPLPWDQQQLFPGNLPVFQLICRQDHCDRCVILLCQIPCAFLLSQASQHQRRCSHRIFRGFRIQFSAGDADLFQAGNGFGPEIHREPHFDSTIP